jgi:hypothetical protein
MQSDQTRQIAMVGGALLGRWAAQVVTYTCVSHMHFISKHEKDGDCYQKRKKKEKDGDYLI